MSERRPVTWMLVAILAGGCATASRRSAEPPVLAAEAPAASSRAGVTPAGPAAASRIAGHSTEARPIVYTQVGVGPCSTMMLGTIHGNEPAGTPLLERLLAELSATTGDEETSVVVVPVVNPDGHARGSRGNARGVDLNRNFPCGNWREHRARHGSAPGSEPETRAIVDLIERYRPARIVSIHQPIGCVDYDGPGRELAEAMAAGCGLPVRKLGARPGSLGSFAGEELGIPTITLELPAGASRLADPVLWERYGPALLATIASRSATAAASEPGPLSEPVSAK